MGMSASVANALTLEAQHAASETLASLAGRELPSLFGSTETDVQQALAKLGRSDRFSVLARDFFSRLTRRSLGYFLSRELSKHVGPNKRFTGVADHSDFNAALDLHCREASRIIKEFSGGWYGRTLQQERQITKDEARKFAHVAFKKLRAELRKTPTFDGAGCVRHVWTYDQVRPRLSNIDQVRHAAGRMKLARL
jgi:hypothetical protein